MESKSKYKSSLAFTDLLFNVLIGFVFMFIVAFILINPVEKDAEIEAKAEFMIIMEWDDQSAYDVDLWMADPVGNIVGFPNMHAGLLHLDKDDLGQSNDKVVLADGTTKTIYLNREVMTIRGIVPGEYIVNNHLYSMKGSHQEGPIEVTTRVIKLNPYGEVHTGIVTLESSRQEETIIRFTVTPEGYVKNKNKRKRRFAGRHQSDLSPIEGSGHSTSISAEAAGEGTQIQGVAEPDDRPSPPSYMIEDNIPADDDEVHAQESDAELNRYDNIDADSRGF
tara:strand:+ start:730 stop:1566 length:837 start_codon:yes stop_codon:yes gene_type:complete